MIQPKCWSDPTQKTTPLISDNIYVGHLPSNFSKEDLIALFAPFGPIVSAKMMLDLKTGDSRGCGFVRFATAQSASKAIDQLNGQTLFKKPLIVKFSKAKENFGLPTRNVLVRSLPATATTDQIKEVFGKVGQITSVIWAGDRVKGAAIITFGTVMEARAAIDVFGNTRFREDLWPMHIRFVDIPESMISTIVVEKPLKSWETPKKSAIRDVSNSPSDFGDAY